MEKGLMRVLCLALTFQELLCSSSSEKSVAVLVACFASHLETRH